ncbi:hypothetical protein CDAR_504361 [Caerostris darwini]|uniref:Maturase K n=1 Tax=Caerostris darwini TaxID=1538125 RepID=A0AAV4S3T2_9ARAC|nr:hypothetical protein CDAR_504361 [Caerostris darwini]
MAYYHNIDSYLSRVQYSNLAIHFCHHILKQASLEVADTEFACLSLRPTFLQSFLNHITSYRRTAIFFRRYGKRSLLIRTQTDFSKQVLSGIDLTMTVWLGKDNHEDSQ